MGSVMFTELATEHSKNTQKKHNSVSYKEKIVSNTSTLSAFLCLVLM